MQQRPGRERARCALQTWSGLTGLDDSMLHRGRDQASDRQNHQRKRGTDQILGSAGQRLKSGLKSALEQESEQHLRPQDKEARFVQRDLYFTVQFQLKIVGLCGAAIADRFYLGGCKNLTSE